MNRVYIVVFWLFGGMIISLLADYFNPVDLKAILRYSFPFIFAMFSLNFSAISACSNAILKYKEMYKQCDIKIVVSEMKENMIAMLIGIVCVFIASFIRSSTQMEILIVACNVIVFSVLIMFIHLIMDVAMAFFDIILKSYE